MRIVSVYVISICMLLITLAFTETTEAQERELTDEEILKLYAGLRVADVADGLDMVGLRDLTLMDQSIEALWKNVNDMLHHLIGIAVTARYVPTNRVIKNPMEGEEFREWEGKWYNEISSEPFVEFIKEGSVIVLDVAGDGDTGSVGSFNSLAWKLRGSRGIVSNGGIRDTDEIILQRIPVYLDHKNRGRGIRPGRNEIESVNKPVSIGGVLVNPGDVIVADGDGVVVVPRHYAEKVAHFARGILDGDMDGRRQLYEQLGMPPDDTVKPPERKNERK
jgi:4-hydroxy-4-methyl-2-oxoglutarate aldolase